MLTAYVPNFLLPPTFNTLSVNSPSRDAPPLERDHCGGSVTQVLSSTDGHAFHLARGPESSARQVRFRLARHVCKRFFGHAVGETNREIEALIGGAKEFAGPGFLLPKRNGELFRWCLQRGLRITQPMTLMSLGLYNKPAGPFSPLVVSVGCGSVRDEEPSGEEAALRQIQTRVMRGFYENRGNLSVRQYLFLHMYLT